MQIFFDESGDYAFPEKPFACCGSRRGTPLIIPSNWTDPSPHPFLEKYQPAQGSVRGVEVENPIDLKAVFEHGLRFES